MSYNHKLKLLLKLKILDQLRLWIELVLWKRHLLKISRFTISHENVTQKPKSFLIFSSIGGNLTTLALDLILSKALELRGHKVKFVLCGGGFDACMYAEVNKYRNQEEFIKDGSKPLCEQCTKIGFTILAKSELNLEVLRPPNPLTKIKKLDSEIAESGAKRFLGIGRVVDSKVYHEVLKRFQSASLQYSQSINELLSTETFDIVIAHHGIYVPQGIVQALSQRENLEFVSWMQGYRRGTYIFSWNDTYHRELLKPFPQDLKLTLDQVKSIENYLSSRDVGTNDWIRFGVTTKEESEVIPLNFSKPTAILLTNVSWDAQLHYKSRLFSDMHEWILQTIEWFIKHPESNLIVRIHPAEETGRIKSQDKIVDYIESSFESLPKNIFVVKPLDKVSTYALIDKSQLAIIFGTKTGLEVAALGKPLLIAGEAWSRNKGIGIEPSTKEDYFKTLDDFERNHATLFRNRIRGLEVAHYFFFRKLIPINSIKAIPFYPYARPKMHPDWIEKDFGLNTVISALENGNEFELPSEE